MGYKKIKKTRPIEVTNGGRKKQWNFIQYGPVGNEQRAIVSDENGEVFVIDPKKYNMRFLDGETNKL